jgi:hypothetical protein
VPGGDREEGNEVNRGHQLNARLTWGVSDRLSLSAQVPFRSNAIRERPDEEARTSTRLTGPGDVSLTVDDVLWRNREVLPSTWLSLRGLGKAPTGDDRASVKGGVPSGPRPQMSACFPMLRSGRSCPLHSPLHSRCAPAASGVGRRLESERPLVQERLAPEADRVHDGLNADYSVPIGSLGDLVTRLTRKHEGTTGTRLAPAR